MPTEPCSVIFPLIMILHLSILITPFRLLPFFYLCSTLVVSLCSLAVCFALSSSSNLAAALSPTRSPQSPTSSLAHPLLFALLLLSPFADLSISISVPSNLLFTSLHLLPFLYLCGILVVLFLLLGRAFCLVLLLQSCNRVVSDPFPQLLTSSLSHPLSFTLLLLSPLPTPPSPFPATSSSHYSASCCSSTVAASLSCSHCSVSVHFALSSVRSTKQGDIAGVSTIVLPCPGS